MGVDPTKRHFRRAVAFGTVGLHPPGCQRLNQHLLFAAVKLLERHIRDLPQHLQTFHQTFWQLHGQRVFQALIRVRRALLVEESLCRTG